MQVDDLPAVVELGNTLFTAETSPTLYRCWEDAEVLQLVSTNPNIVGYVSGDANTSRVKVLLVVP